MSGRSLGRVERRSVQLAREIRAAVVGDLVEPTADFLYEASICKHAAPVVDVLAGETDSIIARNKRGSSRPFGFEILQNALIRKYDPFTSETNRHDAKIGHRVLVGCFKSTAISNWVLLPTQAVTISDSGYTMRTRTTRGPVRSTHEQKRTGAGTPARDGSTGRTMQTNATGKEKGFGLSPTAGAHAGGAA